MALSRAGRIAWERMAAAMAERGANCKDTPEPWTGYVDEQGVEWLPTPKEARDLCAGCPLLDKECLEWKSKGDTTYGVLNAEVIDKWKESGRRD